MPVIAIERAVAAPPMRFIVCFDAGQTMNGRFRYLISARGSEAVRWR